MAKRLLVVLVAFGVLAAVPACAPVGSEAWCAKMKKKSKGDWTANAAADYAKHCIL